MGVLSNLQPEKVFYYFEETVRFQEVRTMKNRSVIILLHMRRNMTMKCSRMICIMLLC